MTLEDELRRVRLEREREIQHHEALMISLKQQLEAAQAKAVRITDTAPARTSPAACPIPNPDESEAATRESDRLAAELRAAHLQIAQLNHDLALAEYAELTADLPEAPTAIDITNELAAARKRIEELLREREKLQQTNHRLTAYLASFGIQSKAL